MEVIRPGTKVMIGGELTGFVTAVKIGTGDVVTYEVAWWSSSARSHAWVEAHEVEVKNEFTGPLRFGFHTNGQYAHDSPR